MLTHDKLMELYRELKTQKVLSVYVDGDQHDPAERNMWRTRLEREINIRKKELEANGDDAARHAFEEAWGHLKELLEPFDAFLPEKGWVGFATPEKAWYGESVSAATPDGIYWEDGLRVAPYVRGLKQERPVLVLLVDSQRARIIRYHQGEATELEDVRADTFMGDTTDVGISKRPSGFTGRRGETSTDLSQRILEVSADRMIKYVMEKVSHELAHDGFLVVGGVQEVVARVKKAVAKGMTGRVTEASSMHVEMSLPEVREGVKGAASELNQGFQKDLLDMVVDGARSNGKACLGRNETVRALSEMRVDTLLLSRTFIRAQPDDAEECVGAAMAQDAAVEELSEESAARLDREGGGIGARLRYRVRGQQAATGD
jgi:peptide subunit release factor 1 (eRF1)